MKVSGKRYVVHNSRSDVFKVWNLSDLHVGNGACAIEQIKADIKKIEVDPYSFWIGGGDFADFVGYRDKRFDPDTVAENISVKDLGNLGKVLIDQVGELFHPIRKKCLGLLYGNHEDKFQKWTEQQELHNYLCVGLGVPNLGYSCLFDLVFCRVKHDGPPKLLRDYDTNGSGTTYSSFRTFVHHGAGWAVTKGGKLKRMLDFFGAFDADLYFLGHVHDQLAVRDVTITANQPCTSLVQKHKLGVISGSYLKTYSQDITTYGEQRGYSPTVLGAATIHLKPCSQDPMERMKATI